MPLEWIFKLVLLHTRAGHHRNPDVYHKAGFVVGGFAHSSACIRTKRDLDKINMMPFCLSGFGVDLKLAGQVACAVCCLVPGAAHDCDACGVNLQWCSLAGIVSTFAPEAGCYLPPVDADLDEARELEC
eukprot:771919-Amphidinium_carterae.1